MTQYVFVTFSRMDVQGIREVTTSVEDTRRLNRSKIKTHCFRKQTHLQPVCVFKSKEKRFKKLLKKDVVSVTRSSPQSSHKPAAYCKDWSAPLSLTRPVLPGLSAERSQLHWRVVPQPGGEHRPHPHRKQSVCYGFWSNGIGEVNDCKRNAKVLLITIVVTLLFGDIDVKEVHSAFSKEDRFEKPCNACAVQGMTISCCPGSSLRWSGAGFLVIPI